MALELNHYRELLAKAMKPHMPAKVGIDAHPGKFDLQEIKRYTAQAPCVRLAVLSFADIEGSALRGPVSCAAYILTKDGKGVQRDAQNLFLGGLIAAWLKAWLAAVANASEQLEADLTALDADAGRPFGIKYQNAYSTYIGEEGLALGIVSWTQHVELAPLAALAAQLGDFLTLGTTFPQPDGSPSIGGVTPIPQE